MPKPKREILYDNLIQSGRVSEYEIGTLDQFRNAIKDKRTADEFYNNLIDFGLSEDEIGTADDFYKSIASDFEVNPQQEPQASVSRKPFLNTGLPSDEVLSSFKAGTQQTSYSPVTSESTQLTEQQVSTPQKSIEEETIHTMEPQSKQSRQSVLQMGLPEDEAMKLFKADTQILAYAPKEEVENIWNDELKEIVDNLISSTREQGRKELEEYNRKVYGDKSWFNFSGSAGQGRQQNDIYAKATDMRHVIDGVSQYLDSKKGVEAGQGTAQSIHEGNDIRNKLMQKVYDYLVQKNTPKGTAEYILRSAFENSTLGNILGLSNGKSAVQRQIEMQGTQNYDATGLEKFAGTAAGIAMDLPVMSVTGGIGGTVGKAVSRPIINNLAKRYMLSGISEEAAKGIASRVIQQSGLRWGIRTASEAANFAALEGAGSAASQLYATDNIDAWKVIEASGKGAATGAVMGLFGIVPEKTQSLISKGLGKKTGKAFGYGTSLGGRTAILAGSSVMGQYMENPDFNINDVDWTDELVHAGLMNIGFDILGVVKGYSAKRRMKGIDLSDINLSKENIHQLNQAGIKGNNAKEITESILQLRDANELRKSPEQTEGLADNTWAEVSQEMAFKKEQSAIGQLLADPNIDLATKAKVGYIITGNYFKLSPSTNVSDVEETQDGQFKVDIFNASGQTNESRYFNSRGKAENYRYDTMNQVKPNQVSALEEMMENASKMSSAIRMFDMFAQQFGISREQVGEIYARGKNGYQFKQTGEEQAKRLYRMLDNTLKDITSTEDYHYSTSKLRGRMDEGYGKESGWMDKVLKKKYNSLTEEERRAYDEYVENMQNILQGEKKEQALDEGTGNYQETVPVEQDVLPVAGTNEMQEIPTNVPTGYSRGEAIFKKHNPQEMRGVIVRERISKERLMQTGMTEQDIESLIMASEKQRSQALSQMDINIRRLAEDYLEQRDAADGLNDALDEAHVPEVQAAQQKVQSMSPNGNVVVVELGKYGDKNHEVGIIVNGMDAEGNYTSPERQVIVIPLETVNGKPDFNSFDENNAISMIPSNVYSPSFLEQNVVLNDMLTDYQNDAMILDAPEIVPGQTYTLATGSGETFNVAVLGKHPSGKWTVQEEGQSAPELISHEDLSEMIGNAEAIPYMLEYAEADKRFSLEQEQTTKEIERQQKKAEKEAQRIVKEQERIAAKQTAEEEQKRIAEEIKKPINRLARYPEGHKRAGMPDYENSDPDDVRAYLVDLLGINDAVKSIRNQIEALREEEKKQTEKLQNDQTEVANSVLGPDEMIAAREFLEEEKEVLNSTRKSLSFWNNLLEITGGKSSEQVQSIVNKAEAAQKSQHSKQNVYKPSKEYTDAQKLMKDSKNALDILSDLNPHTPEELAAIILSAGDIRLTPESLKKESGYSNSDLSGFIGLISKDGMSVREAGDRLMQIDREGELNILDQYDPNAGLNAIIGALSESRTMGNLNRMVERNRIAQAKQLYKEEEAAIMQEMDNASWEEYGMSYEDLQKLQDAITASMEQMPHLVEELKKSDEYIEFINTFVETKGTIDNGKERNDRTSLSESTDEITDDESQRDNRPSPRSEEGYDRDREKVSETQSGERSRRTKGSIEGNQQLSDETGNGETESGAGEIKPEGKKNDTAALQSELSIHKANILSGTKQNTTQDHIAEAREMVNTSPTEAQKEAGNYKKGHVKIDGYDVTIENPKGSVRSGRDANGQEWSITMNNDYGYIRGTKAVDGDHIDIFLSDNPSEGNVFVVDQLNEKGEFDESKVMYGFPSMDEARSSYLANYSPSWENRIGTITEVTKEEFNKWIDSSVKKTKPFSEYKSVKLEIVQKENADKKYSVEKRHHAKKNTDIYAVKFEERYDREKFLELKGRVKEFGGYYSSFGKGGFIFNNVDDARKFGDTITNQITAENNGNERKSMESQAFYTEGKADELRDQAGIEETIAEAGTGRKSGSDIYSRPRETSDGESAEQLITIRHGYQKGDKVMYKGEQAIIYDFEPNGLPILNTGLAPVIYELGNWDDISPIKEEPVTIKEVIEIAVANTPKKKLEKAKRQSTERKNRRNTYRKEIGDLFAKADDLDKELDKLEKQVDEKYTPKWEYSVTVDKETGYTTLNRDDVNGPIPIGDGRFNYSANSPQEMLDILRNPQNGMQEVLDAVGVTLENKIKKRETDRNRTEINELIKDTENGRRIETTDRSLREESRQEIKGTERGRNDRSVHGDHVSDKNGSGRVSEPSGSEQPVVTQNRNNFLYGNRHLELPAGEIGKLKGNIEAIRTLKELEESGEMATPEQKEKLLKFVGWGGLAESLNDTEYREWKRYQDITYWNGEQGNTPWGKKYGSHYEALRPLLTDEEFGSAQASTLSSHYTPETVIRNMWSALEYLGFKGGKILEPAMGVGNIIGFMPEKISRRSRISGYELDSIPGRIAKQLYPDANIKIAGYETEFHPNTKDAIVTNVPFGQIAPIDPALDKTLRNKLKGAYNLHNYFIVKGLLELKPGGVGVFITSSATMDGRNSKAREYISGLEVDLIGAIRLPNNTFKANAGTEVTADILFFRKRLPGEASNGVNFVTLGQIGTGTYEVPSKIKGEYEEVEIPLLVNEYFVTHPEMMLGTVMTAHDAGSGGLYGGDSQTLVARPGSTLDMELADAVTKLPENILEETRNMIAETESNNDKPKLPRKRTGELSVKNGKVYVFDEETTSEVAAGTFKHNKKEHTYADATKDYLQLKNTLKELIRQEREKAEDPATLRKELNDQYDTFVEKYGRLNGNKNLNVILEEDYERFLPQALENIRISIDPSTGKRNKVIEKNTKGILSIRVSQPMTEPLKAENLQDAIDISQAYHGRIDLDYISHMLNIPTEEARERILQGRQAFEDPVTGVLIDRDAYLSGNIRDKLEQARNAALQDSKFNANVSELEASMPETIPFVDISYKIGTPWIPVEVYADFASEVLGISNVSVRYVQAVDEFMLSGGHVSDFTKANDYNTPARSVLDLFNDAINLRKPTIYRQIGKDNRVKDEDATREAVQRIMDMNDAFVRYIQEKANIHSRLQNIYNDRYNNYRLREYREPQFKSTDGKIHYPGANKDITLRTHQIKAVQRSLQGSTLLAHQVGTGKTFTMITTAMEMRRLGLAKKPMIVVQNATLQDFASDFMKLYPSARILVPGEEERSASQRKRLFNLIATGDFDAIIIPQSFLAFIPDDPGRKAALIQQRVDEIIAAANELEVEDKQLANRLRREAKNLSLSLQVNKEEGAGTKKKKTNVKQQAKKAESTLSRESRKLDRRTDDVLTFEQMGVDALFIDEAHNFKKIGFSTKMQNVKGIDTGFSERANSLLLKSTFVQERNGGRNVILATGTPITNTMAEVWTMMRFVAPEILEDYNIKTFDEFAATFGQVEPSLEFTSTGNFKIADRFKSYVNVPELVKAFRSHADVVLTTDVPEFKQSKSIPQLKNGRMTNHVIQKSEKLQEVMDVLIEVLKEDENKHGKDKTPGLPLVVFQKAKQAAIDLRLINPSFPDDPESKTNKVVSEVKRIYQESTSDKGVQMIFCDSYQSPANEPTIDLFGYEEDVPQFNLYRDIKEKLIKEGIPKDQIVIVSEITNADRKKAVFQKARDGEIRVLIGGTEKMGVGVNVQDRMIALHHMDAPIRPMDFEQRNGRILRQGNMYAAKGMPVEILTYGVEGTLDATAYDRLRIKQNFINQMMKGNVNGRVMEDEDSEDPSGKTFNQMAAELSGDQTAQMLFIAENNVKKLEGLKRSHEIKKMYARTEIPILNTSIAVLKSSLDKAIRISKQIAEKFPNGIERISANGHSYSDKLATALADIAGKYEEEYTLNRNTPPVSIRLNKDAAELVLYHDNGQLKYSLYAGKDIITEGKDINTFSGIWISVNSSISSIGKKVSSVKDEIAQKENRLKGMESTLEKPFDKEQELKEARGKVSTLKRELEEKARKNAEKVPTSQNTDENLKLSLLKKNNPNPLQEEIAGDSYENLDRLETATDAMHKIAVNAPHPAIAMNGQDILNAMPQLDNLQMAKVINTSRKKDVLAMYVPWSKQIVLLPNHGTEKEIRDANWHESFHYAIDMVILYNTEGRMLLERASSDVNELDPELSKWVDENYSSNHSEEKVAHLLESVISWMEDHGKTSSLSSGLDFGNQYVNLNEIANKIINFLTHNENDNNNKNYERDTQAKHGENQKWKDEDYSPALFGEPEKGEELKFALRGKPRRKDGESMLSYSKRMKEWQAEKEEAERTRSVEGEKGVDSINEELENLSMEMMSYPHPKRKLDNKGNPAETDEAFDNRVREWENWYNTRGREIRDRMNELHAQAEAEKTEARDEEIKTVDEQLREGKTSENKAPEGFSPDAPDNVNNFTKEEMREIRKSFQERMTDMKISLSKNQIRKDIHQEIIERRRYIESSNLEDAFFVDRLREMTKGNKQMLKNVIDYIEAPAIERMNAEQEKNYNKLTAEANIFKEQSEKTHNQFISIAREWDELENKPNRTDEDEFQLKRKRFMYDKLQQKYLREKKQYENTLREAESNKPNPIQAFDTENASPELKALAKEVADWFEEVYNLMSEEGVLYNAPQIQNYVTHIWDWKRSPANAQEKYTNYMNTIRMRSPFTRHRVIPNYAAGKAMGMVPKYEDITGIILEYGHFATETIANHRFIEFLKNFKVFVPGGRDNMPMDMDIIVPDSVKDTSYSRMDHTALDGYKVLNSIQKYITPVLGDQRILNPKHYSEFTNKLIDGIWVTSGLMKKIALSFSFFHHGALTETAIAMLKPWGAAKVIGKNLIWDVITKGNIPAMNDKEAARDAVKHLVSLGASNDYVTADVNNLTAKLKKLTKDKNIPIVQQAASLLDFLNRGSDKILWDTIHDGYKIASFAKMAKEVRSKAEAKGWTLEQTEKALDECGHLINDTFGGLHFDILGFSPKSVRIMRALLLSPDWTLATIRQALSPLGFGQLYADNGFWKNLVSNEPEAKTRKKYGRDFWITAGIFFYALMNALNAYFRVKDEEEQRQMADERRKTDPEYKSSYELAYPDGMKWYDYTMPGNTIGQQTHLFTGRYSDGTESYARWGKQFRELPELFFGRDGLSFPGPMIDKMSGKANPLLATTFEFISGYSLSGWENKYMKDKKGWEREAGRMYFLASKLLPYSIPTQEDKDFMFLDLVMPSSKGFTPSKAINYFEKGIESGDFNYVAKVYNACVMNELQPEKYFKVAKAKIEAEAKANQLEGIETFQDATKAFDEATNIKDRKRLLRYMEQQLGAQDYYAISQEEIVKKAQDIINGEMPDTSNSDRYIEQATSEDITEDFRMKKNATGLKAYYQDYAELAGSNPDAAKRMLTEKGKFIQGYRLTTTFRSRINKLKKMLGKDQDEKIMSEIRKTRKKYFEEMDKLE